jgi:hypothetical protein
VHHGILSNPNRGRQSFCFRRSIPGIDRSQKVPDPSRKNWVDLKGNELDVEARELLKKLKDEKVPNSGIPASRMFDFQVFLLLFFFFCQPRRKSARTLANFVTCSASSFYFLFFFFSFAQYASTPSFFASFLFLSFLLFSFV